MGKSRTVRKYVENIALTSPAPITTPKSPHSRTFICVESYLLKFGMVKILLLEISYGNEA